jgi:hypothetical protein
MKLIAFLLFFVISTPPEILVVDTGLKKGLKTTEDFTIEEYFHRNFPIYVDDVTEVIEGVQKIAKIIDRNVQCIDTISANRTVIFLQTNCETNKTISVRLLTKIEGKKMFFDFELVRNETNRRLAQQRLLELASYLER